MVTRIDIASSVPGSVSITHRRPVLVIDDDPAIREIVQLVLEDEGYPVTTASEGAEALRYLGSGQLPGMILLDLRMPGMDGGTFREAQCARPELASIPVVIISGDRDALPVAAGLGADCVMKPINLEQLLSIVEQHCGTPG